MTLPAWFRARDWRTGGYHALGALAIQAFVAWVLWANAIPGAWWWGALAGGGFWTVREMLTTDRMQERFWWDAGTAVVPVTLVALVMEFI